VDWTAREVVGVRKGKRRCDTWNQRGVYALYKDFRIIYVGQADSRGIGVRLCEHRVDRFAEPWHSFSFFGICEVDRHGEAKPARRVTVPPTSVIRSLCFEREILDSVASGSLGSFLGERRCTRGGQVKNHAD
jgi:hypothetical protein